MWVIIDIHALNTCKSDIMKHIDKNKMHNFSCKYVWEDLF